jgi:hypothetical protein
MNTLYKLTGVALSALILGGAVAMADGAPLTQTATTLAAGQEGAMVVALVNSGDSQQVAAVAPVQVAAARQPSAFAGQSALLRAPAAPQSR